LEFQEYERLLTAENDEYAKFMDKKTILRTFFSEIIEMNKKQNCKNTLCALCVLCLEETPLERLK